jgi:hypothetical protein
MIAVTGSAAPCRCAFPTHENPSCPHGAKLAAQGSLYAGMYGSRSGATPIRRTAARMGLPRPLRQVKLLNPDYDDEDAAGRRFAQLEID